MNISTKTDAYTLVSNSGVEDWDWGTEGCLSAAGFAEYIWENCITGEWIDSKRFDELLAAYIASNGVDPLLFGLGK